MCLMIQQTADVVFDYNDIQDFYSHNQDGIGVMWVEGGAVQVRKILAKTSQEAYEFYLANIKGKDCSWHLRMRTHGDIDIEHNCHPYAIPDTPAWLMHNGVLATGNDKDKTKSDTWWYARDYLQPLLTANPQLIFVKAFQDMLGVHIGSGNRFILMSPEGSVVINEHHGVKYKGAWMSNTYAWSAPRVASTHQVWAGFYDEDEWVTPPIQTEADLDIELAVEFFYEVIENAGLWEVLSRVRMQEVEAAVAYVGVDDFYTFCDYIFDMALPDEVVIDYIKHPEDIPEFDLAEAA